MKFTTTGSFIALPVLALALTFAGAACQTTGNTSVSTTNANRMSNMTNMGNMTSNADSTSNMSNMTTSKGSEENENIDVQFIDMMMSHHADGIKMSQMAVSKAQTPEVKAFAEKTAAMQREDSQKLEGFRGKFFAGAPKSDHIPMKGREEMMMTEMMKMGQDDMKKLEAAKGAEFDRLFLDTMTKHHQLAIDMATEEKTRGKQADVKADAEKNIADQTKGIGEMAELKKKVGDK